MVSLERRHRSVRQQLDGLMDPSSVPAFGYDEWQDDINELIRRLRELRITLSQKKALLQVSEQEQISTMSCKDFIADRLVARALKLRLRDALVARKFEMQRLQQGLAASTSTGVSFTYLTTCLSLNDCLL